MDIGEKRKTITVPKRTTEPARRELPEEAPKRKKEKVPAGAVKVWWT